MKKTNILKSGLILISFMILPSLLACNGKADKNQLSYQALPEFGMYLNYDDSDFKQTSSGLYYC